MPRKPKIQKTQIIVSVNGAPISVTMFPPQGAKRSWYAYWKGLKARKTTGEIDYNLAVIAVDDMLNYGSGKRTLADAIISDEEFEQIQRRHYGKKTSPDAKRRAAKSLEATLDAILAFKQITGVKPVTIATPLDCENFQHEALQRPRNWRSKHPKSRQEHRTISPNTIDKWSRALQAAFERANENAGRKCVRGVVADHKLLRSNPWHKFTWIEGFEREIRQFDSDELLAVLEYFNSHWKGLVVASLMTKVFLWSWSRRNEVASLRWSDHRQFGIEHHFQSLGKSGVEKWFRIPESVYQDLATMRTSSPYVFAAFNDQLREFHAAGRQPWQAHRVRQEFTPENLGEWFYRQVAEWSKTLIRGNACIHVFRKTSLQYARGGEDANARLARDARVGELVMMTNYVKETDVEMRQRSNRMFWRIRASLSPEVARQYGYVEQPPNSLAIQVAEAVEAQDWQLAAILSAKLARQESQAS